MQFCNEVHICKMQKVTQPLQQIILSDAKISLVFDSTVKKLLFIFQILMEIGGGEKCNSSKKCGCMFLHKSLILIRIYLSTLRTTLAFGK